MTACWAGCTLAKQPPFLGFRLHWYQNVMGFYHLFLEEIYVNGKRLDILDKYLQMASDQSGGIIINSRTTYTLLNDFAFGKVRSKFEAYYQDKEPNYYQRYELRYDYISGPRPKLMFSFKGFNFTISGQNTWVRFRECLV